MWHAFVCSPGRDGLPGQQYFAGTTTRMCVVGEIAPFFAYLNAAISLQRGRFVADVAVYYGATCRYFSQL